MAKTPTPEEIEAARQLVAEADAAAAAERKAAVIEKLKPFTDAGLGATADGGAVGALIAAMRANYASLAEIDGSLPNLAFSTGQVLQTLDDRVRSLAAMNAPAPAEA
ncbi:hypothetical protein [uncultured Brevundimonas sp.]|uniref:hypothetical protein n=1 Tax=uncultured Brevundimonas sp. TaxID=213418 RepID=UPI0025D575B5|nr:hypothetical protein [uncultured Brevundimonas sp.]